MKLRYSMLNDALFCLTFLSLCASATHAQDDRVASIKQYLNSDTALVAWLDVNDVDLPALQAFAKKHGITTGPMTELASIQKGLQALQVKRVYLVGSFVDMSQGGPLIVVASDKERVETVQLLLSTAANSPTANIEIHGTNVLVGSQEMLNRYKNAKAESNDQLTNAMNEAKHPNGVVVRLSSFMSVFLSPFLREVIGGLQLKQPVDVEAVGQTIMAIQTISLSASLPPKSATLKIKTTSEDSAKSLANLADQVATENALETAKHIQGTVEGQSILLNLEDEKAVNSAIEALNVLFAPARADARQMQKMNSMKQIGLAVHNYYDVFKHLPPQALADENGKKLLSWRVLILPFIDQNDLYEQFHLDEPWDSEHNLKLVSRMPPVYSDVPEPDEEESKGKTRMLAPLMANSIFGRKGPGTTFREILDGTSNTFLVVEAPKDKAVIWTKPDDIEIPEGADGTFFTEEGEDGFLALRGDGAVAKTRSTVSAKNLKALITMNGGEIVDVDDL